MPAANLKKRNETRISIVPAAAPLRPRLLIGDCLKEMKNLSDKSVDLIFTSPPYAEARKSSYGGIAPKNYAAWFMPRANEMMRILKPSGSFVLNIKEKTANGEKLTYVLEIIQKMREEGWLWTEEYIWHKKNAYPGKWPNRFRDAWERLLHFTKKKKFKMLQENVMIPAGDWQKKRLHKLSQTDKIRDESRSKSGFGKNISHWVGREKAYPTNVLHMATECANTKHSAAFPLSLPEWFIKLFTEPRDTVLDPFCGSGTTLIAARNLNRESIGIEILPEYEKLIFERIKKTVDGKTRKKKEELP